MGSGCHCTTGDIALHILLHITIQWCARFDQAQDIPNPLPPMAMAIRNSLNELRRARGEPGRGACKLIWGRRQPSDTRSMVGARAMTSRPLVLQIPPAVSLGAMHAEA